MESGDFRGTVSMRSIVMFAILALVVAGVVPRLYANMNGTAASAAKAAPAEAEPTPANSRSMSISRGDDGHFNVEAVIDGRRMDFLVDTGASVIALREGDAARLGIHPAARDYTANVSTANGTVRAARVELNRVEVGALTVRNVAALVLPDAALGRNLLGMSFLSRVRWEHRNGRLVLEQ
jgi:aspartyl protease family protein